MHSLLARQMKRLLPQANPTVDELENFLAAVDAAYQQADADRQMIERSMAISSGELTAANEQLQLTLHRAQLSEEQYRALVETSQSAVLLLDADHLVDFANGGFEAIFSRDRAGVIGMSLASVLGLEAGADADALMVGLESGGFRSVAIAAVDADGKQLIVEVSATPIEVGSQAGLLVDVRDVTEERASRRRADQIRVLESERRNSEALAESISGGLLLTDSDGRVTYCNGRYEDLVGEPRSLVIGRLAREAMDRLAERTRVPEDASAGLRAASERAETNPAFTVDLVTPEARSLRVAWFAIQTEDGEYIGHGQLLTDVTRDREIDRMKSEFVALASHELRTPLTSIYGFSDLLREDERLSADQLEWISFIHTEAERLSTIVDRLLNVSRIEAGELTLADESISAIEVVAAAIGAAVPPDLQHRLSSPNIPAVAIRGDRGAIVQVLANLIDNALKYSADAPISVACRVLDNGEVEFEVSDSGPGIPERELPRLFDRFHRVARPEFDRIRSTGLGLYVVNEYVERMGGRVGVQSTEGVGSSFTVTFLAALEAVDQVA